MIRYLLCILLLPALTLAESPHDVFPEGKGKQTVINNCTVCHSYKLITQSSFSKRRWNELIDWMQEKQGLWQLTPEDREEITSYLATHYGEKLGCSGMYSSSFSRPNILE